MLIACAVSSLGGLIVADMKLSRFFTLAELTESDWAARHDFANDPTPEVMFALINTAARLDLIREHLDKPVIVTSGYRSPTVNTGIGGSKTSDHMTGWAADIKVPGFGTPREVWKAIRDSGIFFDQLILEREQWTHVGFGPRNRGEVLVYDGKTYQRIN